MLFFYRMVKLFMHEDEEKHVEDKAVEISHDIKETEKHVDALKDLISSMQEQQLKKDN